MANRGTIRRAAILAVAAGVSVSAGPVQAQDAARELAYPGVEDMQMARMDWILQCQGCHGPTAEGSPGGAPNMNGLFARFLATAEGRAYLGRVPGVVNTPLGNDRLANLMNWSLYEFDAGHVPADFTPYTGNEMAELRSRPLVSEAAAVRAKLLEAIE